MDLTLKGIWNKLKEIVTARGENLVGGGAPFEPDPMLADDGRRFDALDVVNDLIYQGSN